MSRARDPLVAPLNPAPMQQYRSPRWLAGGNAQTLWPALFGQRFRGEAPRFSRERWTAPDGDFIDVDRQVDMGVKAEEAAPLLVLFHGLEGSSASHYAQAFAHRAGSLGWHFALPHFRGCSGEINLAPRAYHSGDHEEIGWIIERFRASHAGALFAAGVSLGGNALLRWAEEMGAAASSRVDAIASVSAPLDLAAGGHAIGLGFNRQVYTRMFLRTMKPKALRKWAQHPGLFDRDRLIAARDLHAFDDVFTAPLHGFRGVDDYWSRASAKPQLQRIRVPALVLNARNDPFVPAASLPSADEAGGWVTLWQPRHGGHVGFPGGRWPGDVHTMPEQVCDWLALHLPSSPHVMSAAAQPGTMRHG